MAIRPPLVIGRVSRASGLRGEVRVRLANEDSDVLAPGRVVLVGDGRPMKVLRAQRKAHGWNVAFEGVAGRDAAEALRGAPLAVPWDELPPSGEDEFYYEEVRGYEVVGADGEHIGEVVGVFPTNVDMLVVREGTRELYIPVLDGFVERIDHAARRIVVDPPEGLLDLP